MGPRDLLDELKALGINAESLNGPDLNVSTIRGYVSKERPLSWKQRQALARKLTGLAAKAETLAERLFVEPASETP